MQAESELTKRLFDRRRCGAAIAATHLRRRDCRGTRNGRAAEVGLEAVGEKSYEKHEGLSIERLATPRGEISRKASSRPGLTIMFPVRY